MSTRNTNTITLRFEMEDAEGLTIGLTEELHVAIEGGQYLVTSEHHSDWRGKGETKIAAILAYLSARMGYIIEPSRKSFL